MTDKMTNQSLRGYIAKCTTLLATYAIFIVLATGILGIVSSWFSFMKSINNGLWNSWAEFIVQELFSSLALLALYVFFTFMKRIEQLLNVDDEHG